MVPIFHCTLAIIYGDIVPYLGTASFFFILRALNIDNCFNFFGSGLIPSCVIMYSKYSNLGTENLHLPILHFILSNWRRLITSSALDKCSLNDPDATMSKLLG